MGKVSQADMKKAVNMMEAMSGTAAEQQVKSIEVLKKDFEAILDSQNEIILATLSIYKAVEAIAEKQGVKLPKPLVRMEVEE